MSSFNVRSPLGRFLCCFLSLQTALGTVGFARAQTATVEAEKVQTATASPLPYAPPSSCAVIAIRPARMLTSPAFALMPIEVLQAASIQQLDIDPLEVEQVTIAFEPPLAGIPSYSAVAAFRQQAKLPSGPALAALQAGTLQGRPYLQNGDPAAPSVWLADDRTLVAGPDSFLQRLVADPPKARPTSLAVRAAQELSDDDLYVAVDLALLRPIIKAAVAQAEIPPEAADLKKLPDLIDVVRLRLNMSQAGPIQAILIASREQSAERLLEMFAVHKAKLWGDFSDQTARLLADPDPVQQALGRYQQRMAKYWDERFQLQRVGREIRLLDFQNDGLEGSEAATLATIGVLAALLLPAIQAAREAARRNQSMNNLKILELGLLNYESASKRFPAHASYDENGRPLLSWRVHILPYVEQQALYEQFHLDEPWDSEHNRTLIAKMPMFFYDPSSKLAPEEGKTHYLAVVGDDMAFRESATGRTMAEYRDGLSNTVNLVQVAHDRAVTWTKPEDWSFDEQAPLKGLINSLHPGVFLAAFADGHVQAIANEIDEATWEGLLTVQGQENGQENVKAR